MNSYEERKMIMNDIEKNIDKLIRFDGVTLGVWGVKNDNIEEFFILFDIDMDIIFSLLSFDEYEYRHNIYVADEKDTFILNSLFDVLMNLKNCSYKYIDEKSIDIYFPSVYGNVCICIRLIDDEYVIYSYEKTIHKEGRKPFKVGIYNHDSGEFDDFPESFDVDNVADCYYSFI